MVTKAIIKSIESAYEVKVTIPLFDTANTPLNGQAIEYSTAIICTLPQCTFVPQVGDVVLVAFEDYDIGKPVIIGCLFKESGNLSSVNLEIDNLTVNSFAKLNRNTQIGDITYQDLLDLKQLLSLYPLDIEQINNRLSALENNSTS